MNRWHRTLLATAWQDVLRLGLLATLLLCAAPLAGVADDPPPATPEESKPATEVEKKEAAAAPASTSPAATREFQSVPGAPTPAAGARGEGEWFIELRYAINRTNVKGNQDRSFLHEGVNHLAETTLLHKRPVFDIRRFEGMGLFRFTDDPRIDPEINSLQRGYLRLSGPTFEANFGDYLTNYSRFSFNQNTKGLNAWKRLPVGAGLRLTGTAGVFSDRWGSIFRGFEKFVDPTQVPDPQFPTKPYTRLVLGGRVEQSWSENAFVALNYSQGSDFIRSLPRQAQLRPVNNHLLSVDTSLRVGRDFNLAGELAFSFTEFDKRIQPDLRNDYAARFEASHRWQRVSWRVDYARFAPNFFSLNARQVQDLQDFAARVSVDLMPDVVASASFRHTNDNLRGNPVVVFPAGTPVVLTNAGRTRSVAGSLQVFPFIVDENGTKLKTTVRSPEVRLTWRRLPPRASLQVNVGYRERQFETSNKESFRRDATTGALVLDPVTGEAIALFRDRVTKIPFVDLDWSLGSSLLGFSYEYRHNRDRVIRSNSTFTNRFVASYRGSYFWGDWVVSPSLRFETEPEAKQVEPSTLDLLLNPLLRTVTAHDQTRSIQGSVTVDFPKYFSLEAFYRELNAELLTPFVLNTDRLFGNGGYDRPYFRAALTYKIQNSEDRFLRASFERSVNTFLTADPTAADLRSFRENVVQFEFVLRWRR